MEKKTRSVHAESFLAPIWKANPLFVLILGTCPALATTTSIESALGMGLLFTFVLVCSNVLISALRKVIPDEVHVPAYIVIIATFVSVVEMFTKAYLPPLYSSLGVFISLLVVNCIVLGRAEAFANKNTVLDSLLDGLGNGIGYTIALLILGACREILGTGEITFGSKFTFIPLTHLPILKGEGFDFSMPIFTTPAGAFIVFGIVMAVIAAVNNHKADVEKEKARQERLAAAKAKTAAAASVGKEAK